MVMMLPPSDGKGHLRLLFPLPKAFLKFAGYHGHHGRLPTPQQVASGTRYVGLALLALAIGSASLTFNWIVAHRPDSNFIAEFAGGVIYPSDILLFLGLVFSLALDCSTPPSPWPRWLPSRL